MERLRRVKNAGTAVVCVIAMLAVCSSASGETMTLQDGLDGYSGTADVWLSQAYASANLGGDEDIGTRYYDGSTPATTLIKFDLSGMPDGITIESAELSLYLHWMRNDADIRVSAHRMKRRWIEGTGTRTAPLDYSAGSTWNHWDTSDDSSWSDRPDGAAGAWGSGDADDTYTDRINDTTPEINSWYNLDITTDVQAWNSGAENRGWVLRDNRWDREPRFYSSDYSDDITQRPKLTIQYVPEPATLTLLGLGLAGGVLRRRK